MKPACLMLVVALSLSACASALPNVVAISADPTVANSDSIIRSNVNPLAGFIPRSVTSPKNWRDLNDAQAKTGASK